MKKLVRKLELGTPPVSYPEDCERIRKLVLSEFGVSMSWVECETLWCDVSSEYAAGWLFCDDDDDILRIISEYYEVVDVVG